MHKYLVSLSDLIRKNLFNTTNIKVDTTCTLLLLTNHIKVHIRSIKLIFPLQLTRIKRASSFNFYLSIHLFINIFILGGLVTKIVFFPSTQQF